MNALQTRLTALATAPAAPVSVRGRWTLDGPRQELRLTWLALPKASDEECDDPAERALNECFRIASRHPLELALEVACHPLQETAALIRRAVIRWRRSPSSAP